MPLHRFRSTEDVKGRKSILNHKPADFVQPDSVMTSEIKDKHVTVSAPKVAAHLLHIKSIIFLRFAAEAVFVAKGQSQERQVPASPPRRHKRRHDRQGVLELDNRAHAYPCQGDITKTIGGGVAVRFKGLEALTTQPTLAPLSSKKRKGTEPQ